MFDIGSHPAQNHARELQYRLTARIVIPISHGSRLVTFRLEQTAVVRPGNLAQALRDRYGLTKL